MTKEDYMKLSKERLAELLVERDNVITPPREAPLVGFLCPYGGSCGNPFRDCVGCPGVITGGHYRTNITYTPTK